MRSPTSASCHLIFVSFFVSFFFRFLSSCLLKKGVEIAQPSPFPPLPSPVLPSPPLKLGLPGANSPIGTPGGWEIWIISPLVGSS